MPRKRNNRIDFMLDDEEYFKLKDLVKKTKLNQSEVIRSAIFNVELKEKPDRKFYELINSISRIGNNINQIARRLNKEENVDRNYILSQGELLNEFISETRKRYG